MHTADVGIRHAMGLAAAAELARLESVDHVAVGLGDFGRPDGFLQRQAPRWLGELDSYRAMATYETRIPGLDEVSAWLDEHRPEHFTPGILHGDYHLANLMSSPDGPDVAAIVDWEMATVGDPLLDLGWLLATFPDPESPVTTAMAGVGQTAPLLGTTRAELVAEYAAASQRDLTQVRWYAVLACFKVGIVLEGTHARSCAGKAPEPPGEAMHTITVALFEHARPSRRRNGEGLERLGRPRDGRQPGPGPRDGSRVCERGADVVIASRKLSACDELAEEVRQKHGVRALPVAAHVGEWADCDRLVDTAYAERGRVDILVNNAGMSPLYPSLPEVSEALWHKVIAVNLMGRSGSLPWSAPGWPPGTAEWSSTSSRSARSAPTRAPALRRREGRPERPHRGLRPRLRLHGPRERDHGRRVPH